jgi:hypothetical protein
MQPTDNPDSCRFERLLREKNWCCQTGLNCRPLHYQWSALPLSYGSMPGYENRPKRTPPRRPILATRPPHAQARGRPPGSSKYGKNQRGTPAYASIGSVAARSGSRFPRPAPPAPRSGEHDLECDDFARVTPLRCHLPILAARIACSPPGIGDCADRGRNTIYSDHGEACRSWPREATKRCRTFRVRCGKAARACISPIGFSPRSFGQVHDEARAG